MSCAFGCSSVTVESTPFRVNFTLAVVQTASLCLHRFCLLGTQLSNQRLSTPNKVHRKNRHTLKPENLLWNGNREHRLWFCFTSCQTQFAERGGSWRLMHTKLGWNDEGADLQVTHIAMSASTHLLLVPFNLPSYSAPLPGCLYLSSISSTSPGSFLLGAPQWSLSLVGDILAFDPCVFGSDVAPPGLSELRWPFPGAHQCHIHLKKKPLERGWWKYWCLPSSETATSWHRSAHSERLFVFVFVDTAVLFQLWLFCESCMADYRC